MKNLLRNPNFYYMLLIDAVMVSSSYLLSYLLRYEISIPYEAWDGIRRTLPWILPFKLIAFYAFNLYRGMWRYTSVQDLKNVVKASSLSSIVIVLTVLFLFRFEGFPRSVFAIDWVLTLLFISGARIAVRLILANNISSFWKLRQRTPASRHLLIIGAGDAGEKAIRELQENPNVRMRPIGFLDDDEDKQGKMIHGVPVLGIVDDIDHLPEPFDEILIATPSARAEQMRRIVAACERTGRRYRTMPGIGELIDGKVSVKAIREVTIEDVLGREEVRLNQDAIRGYLEGRRILVTGAGGSIGSELVRQIRRYRPAKLGVLEFSEFNLFSVESECRRHFAWIPVKGYLADIRDRSAVCRVFADFRPEVVFHAAAYKHVPIQEEHPHEAVRNNVAGTRNVIDSAVEAKAERFVLVSTDKAVRPTSVMGTTKRVAEMMIECLNGRTATRFMAVRFGNVLGSSGSVVPIFQQQIAQGGPVTVTHPEVTRYFMTIPEAAQLILQAGAMGEGGEIFILDMGKPVRIADMARDMIRLNGFEPDKEIPIRYIGLRPGEKLYEELITEGEGIASTAHEKIRVIRGRSCDADRLDAGIRELVDAAHRADAPAIKKMLAEIVPEYTPSSD